MMTKAREHALARAGEVAERAHRARLAPADGEDRAIVLAAHLLRASARRLDSDGIPVAVQWSMRDLWAACREAIRLVDEIGGP